MAFPGLEHALNLRLQETEEGKFLEFQATLVIC